MIIRVRQLDRFDDERANQLPHVLVVEIFDVVSNPDHFCYHMRLDRVG